MNNELFSSLLHVYSSLLFFFSYFCSFPPLFEAYSSKNSSFILYKFFSSNFYYCVFQATHAVDGHKWMRGLGEFIVFVVFFNGM